jgi:hypothetical protein
MSLSVVIARSLRVVADIRGVLDFSPVESWRYELPAHLFPEPELTGSNRAGRAMTPQVESPIHPLVPSFPVPRDASRARHVEVPELHDDIEGAITPRIKFHAHQPIRCGKVKFLLAGEGDPQEPAVVAGPNPARGPPNVWVVVVTVGRVVSGVLIRVCDRLSGYEDDHGKGNQQTAALLQTSLHRPIEANLHISKGGPQTPLTRPRLRP